MAQHKAPTAVTFAPTQDSSGFRGFVERYWKIATLAAVAVSAVVIYSTYSIEETKKVHDQSWEKLLSVAADDPANPLGLTGSPSELREIEGKIHGTEAGPWALYVAATTALTKREFDEADKAIKALQLGYPNHPLVADKLPLDDAGKSASAVEILAERLGVQKAWVASHAGFFENAAPAADAPKVKLHTDQGDILITLYAKDAPKHVENFLKLVREGYYAGTKFHRVQAGIMIQGGDPNSKTGDPTTWGQGGPEYKVDHEENELKHFPGYLSAAKTGTDKQESGSQFFITTGDAHHLDGQRTVFGKVLEGMDVVGKIERAKVTAGTDRPEAPVTIQSVEVL